MIDELWRMFREIWNGNGGPEEWNTGIMVPIRKKGEGDKVEVYRGATLMCTASKV